MHVPTLNLRIQVLPAFAPLNRKKKFVKECHVLNVESNLFTLHLERVQLPKRVLNSLSNILKTDDSDETQKVKENNEHIGKIAKCLATFSVGAIPLSWKQSVMFAVISDTNPDDKLQSSATFSQFLNFLVEINQNLIIDLNGELAILQAMSCSLATLTCLKEAFHEPMRKLFESQNVQHLSKKMVALLLDDVMSLKNNMATVSQQGEGSEKSTAEPITEAAFVNPVKTNQKSVKLGRTQSYQIIGNSTNQVETGVGNVSVGLRKAKRPREDQDGMKSPKRMKRSYESPQKNQTLRPPKLSRTKSAASWRGQMFLEKSKEMRQKSFVADDDGSSCLSVSQGDSFGKSGNAVATSPSAGDEQVLSGISELKSKDDLLKFLHQMYEKAFEGEGGLMTAAQNVVRASIQYFTQHVNTQENCSNNGLVLEETYNLLTEHILSNNLQIRDKYVNKNTPEFDEFKLKELQLQCLLYCEVDTACSKTKICCDTIEPRHEKVVAMLRTMSFIKDTNFLSTFLNTTMLENYHRSSPRFLYKIYDSLIHPLPIQLEYLMSPDKLEDDFFLASPINTDKSIASLITNPKVESSELELDELLQMEKQTRLTSKNQRSISFTQAPRMKIELPTKKTVQQQRRSERIATKPIGNEEKDHKSKVRRSLFNDNRSPEPSPNKKHQTPVKSMPAHYVLKTKQVKETPVGRQGVNRYLKKQEKLLQNLSSNDITFVEETPEKNSGVDVSFTQLETKLDISASFYSTKHMTARFAHLEKRMTETRPEFLEQIPVQLSLSQVAQPLKSPKRRVTARMLFGSPVSPSPQKSALKTILEEKNDNASKNHKSPQSPSFRSPRRQQQQQQTFKTPENMKSPKTRDVPEKLLKVRRAILMTPSPSRKSSGPKITSPKSLVLRSPSPRRLTNVNTPRRS